jgi:ABC-type dipeptide/oligopeptide/nickel transport system permease component
MQLAPGDPLKMALGQGGSQGVSGATREAFVHQRRQWKLDKPAVLNFRWFRDYSGPAHHASLISGLSDAELLQRLEAMQSQGKDPDLLAFCRGLGIEAFDAQLADPERRKGLVDLIRKGLEILVEESMAEHSVRAFSQLLDDPDLRIRIGSVRCLTQCTLGDPFLYTYSRDPLPEETDGVVTTWKIWWDRESGAFKALTPERLKTVTEKFKALVDEPSRSKIIEGIADFTREDATFLAGILFGDSSLKEKYVASAALRQKFGKPLKVDVVVGDSEQTAAPVTANWKAYVRIHESLYDASFVRRMIWIFTDTQYANSLTKLLRFDFGRSMVKPYDPVGPKILDAALVSAPLMLVSETLIYLIAVPLGVLCAVYRGRSPDRLITLNLFTLNSIPSVVLGMTLLTYFCFGTFLKIFPMYGLHSEGYEAMSGFGRAADYVWHAALPIVCLTLSSLASLAMFGRSSMLDTINQDYVRTARAKGLAEPVVILKHALRNAMIPVITLFSTFIPAMLGGSVIVEVLFGIPGMGRLSFSSIEAKDYNTMMALIYIDAIIVMLSILLSDLLYVLVDPRISFEKSEVGG